MGGIFCVSNTKQERYLQVSNLRLFQDKSVCRVQTEVQILCIYSQLSFDSGCDLWQMISRETTKQKERDGAHCDEEQISVLPDTGMAILAHLAPYLFFEVALKKNQWVSQEGQKSTLSIQCYSLNPLQLPEICSLGICYT